MAETVGLLVTENRRIGNVFSRKIRLDRTIVDLTSRDSVYKVQEPAIFIEHTLPVIDVLEGNPRTVDVHIKRLREKIKDHEDWAISTVWGIGYKFEVKHP